MDTSVSYILHLADNALILGQRLSEWCGHGPILEQDMAMTNISLDLVGQSRSLFQLAGEIEGKNRSEDDLAFLRVEIDYKNCLLVEQPNGDFAKTIVRQFFYDAYNFHNYTALLNSNHKQVRAIAEKSLKEITYHLKWSSEWIIRLGDGTEESLLRVKKAIMELWKYTGELFTPADYEIEAANSGLGVDLEKIESLWSEEVNKVFGMAGLKVPERGWMQKGGKNGAHTEHLGFILTEMQYLQRTYPGQKW